MYLSPVKNLTGTSAMQLQQPKVSGPEMKKYGAVNMRATVTGKNTIGTMTLWRDPKCWKQVSLKLEPQLVLQLACP